MTSAQIGKATHIHDYLVSKAIERCAVYTPSIASKYVDGRLWFKTEFTLEETKAILKELKCSRLQVIYIEENFKETAETDLITIIGTNEFVRKWNMDPEIKCCNTCKYLFGKNGSKQMPQPFCKVYERFLENFNAKVYEDWCTSYSYIDLPKPRKWFRENAPKNLNMFGETNTVNGIDKSRFMSGEECAGQPVEIIDQIGFDK